MTKAKKEKRPPFHTPTFEECLQWNKEHIVNVYGCDMYLRGWSTTGLQREEIPYYLAGITDKKGYASLYRELYGKEPDLSEPAVDKIHIVDDLYVFYHKGEEEPKYGHIFRGTKLHTFCICKVVNGRVENYDEGDPDKVDFKEFTKFGHEPTLGEMLEEMGKQKSE